MKTSTSNMEPFLAVFVILVLLCVPIIKACSYDWDWRCLVVECRIEKDGVDGKE